MASDNVFAVEEDTHSGGVLGDPLVCGLVPLGILRGERRGRGGEGERRGRGGEGGRIYQL